MNKVTSFFKQTYAEMKHVIWPTRRRAVVYAMVVMIFSVVLGYMLGGFDMLFKFILEKTLY